MTQREAELGEKMPIHHSKTKDSFFSLSSKKSFPKTIYMAFRYRRETKYQSILRTSSLCVKRPLSLATLISVEQSCSLIAIVAEMEGTHELNSRSSLCY